MSALPEIVPSLVDHIKQTLVGLKMPRAIEIFDVIVRRLERGEITAIEAIDVLLAEELTLRENRRIKIALVMARLSTIKTLAGFDFSFQPSLDKNRIMALAELEFINRSEVVHFLASQPKRLRVLPFLELQRQYPHADKVGPVNALEAFGNHGAHAEQVRPLCRPISRRT